MLKRDTITAIIIAVAIFIQCIVPSFFIPWGISIALFIFIRIMYNQKVPDIDKQKKKKGARAKRRSRERNDPSDNKYEWMKIDDKLRDIFVQYTDNFHQLQTNRVGLKVRFGAIIFAVVIGALGAVMLCIVLSDTLVDEYLEETTSTIFKLLFLKVGGILLLNIFVFMYYDQQRGYVEGSGRKEITYESDKYKALRTLMTLHDNRNAAFIMTPQVEMRIKPPHTIRDIRLLLSPKSTMQHLLCWMVSVSMNKVESSVYPYAYAVVVFKGSIQPAKTLRRAIYSCVSRAGTRFKTTVSYEDNNTIIVINLAGKAYRTDEPELNELYSILCNLPPELERIDNSIGTES